MNQKIVCYYCGTIYDEERGKCPLCGSTTRSSDEAPVRRPRQPDGERTVRRSAQGGKFAAKKPQKKKQDAPKGVLVAAVVFLSLAVLVVLYFIGDMIGWWPGLEDRVDRDNPSVSVADTNCTELTLKPESLEFAGAGQTKELTVRVNLSCEEKVYCHSEDMNVVTISEQASTAMGEQTKSVTFTVTAVAQGETKIVVECGDQSASCAVVCTSSDPVDPGQPSNPDGAAPVLNYPVELTLTEKGASETLRVMNLPEGAEAIWRSADESVASVDADGTVTAVGSGTTTVTVEVNGRTAETTIRCTFGTETEPSSSASSANGAHLQSGREDVSVSVGEKFDLYLYDSQGNHIDDITYTVEDPDVCEVKDSYVIALSRGTTKITVTYQGQEFVCIVRVG